MTESEKMKRKFRASKAWKDFRHSINVEQKGVDPITGCKLSKSFNCHHRIQDKEQYTNIEDKSHYVGLNKETHDVVHFILRYVKKYGDLRVLDNLYEEIRKEIELN